MVLAHFCVLWATFCRGRRGERYMVERYKDVNGVKGLGGIMFARGNMDFYG